MIEALSRFILRVFFKREPVVVYNTQDYISDVLFSSKRKGCAAISVTTLAGALPEDAPTPHAFEVLIDKLFRRRQLLDVAVYYAKDPFSLLLEGHKAIQLNHLPKGMMAMVSYKLYKVKI